MDKSGGNGKVFGYNTKTGLVSSCAASPENQGKGNCPHGEHFNFTNEELKDGIIQKTNEKINEERFQAMASIQRNIDNDGQITSKKIKTHQDGNYISKEELEAGTIALSNSFKNKDWKFISEFCDQYERCMTDEERQKEFANDPINNIENYLRSDDRIAINLREFLGKDIDLREFSEIIVSGVSATKSLRWSSGRHSVKRVVLSSINNDMTKERYIASVLFFGGRCCYCNKHLKKAVGTKQQVTGEHITPISPYNEEDISGATRYGNIALCCSGCNKSRANHRLESWMRGTTSVDKKDKSFALARIKAFREFSLYSEYTKEDNDRILNKVKELNEYVDSVRDNSGKVSIDSDIVRDKIKIAIYDLQHGNDRYDPKKQQNS